MVATLVALEPEAETEAEVAATGEVKAVLVAPKPKVEVEAAGVLQVPAIVPPSEAGPSTSREAASFALQKLVHQLARYWFRGVLDV